MLAVALEVSVDFIDQLKAIASRIPSQLEFVKTEEATKTAFVMPFIAALGYNIFDPSEVIPELIADVGVKKGEKVDYAIAKDGKPVILFECKWHGANLDAEHASQLHRYFHVTPARIGVLTNGVIYRFYSDLEEQNKMDSKPFLELNMLELKENIVDDVKRFSKGTFAIDEIVSAAHEMKYTRELKKLLAEQFARPTDEFVKFFASQVYNGKFTQKVYLQFGDFTKRAFNQFINDRINDRLKSAMSSDGEPKAAVEASPIAASSVTLSSDQDEKEDKDKIVTTQDEWDAYYIVKAILRQIVDPKRIILRDTQSYAGILLDDNNRKPICRLRFSSSSKSISILDSSRTEEKFQIRDLNEIFIYSDKLKEAVLSYEGAGVKDSDSLVAGIAGGETMQG